MKSFFLKCKNILCLVKSKIKSFFSNLISLIQKWMISFGSKIISFREKLSFKNNKEIKSQGSFVSENLSKEPDSENAQQADQESDNINKTHVSNKESNSCKHKFIRGILQFFDIIFELVFACGIIFYMRPKFLKCENFLQFKFFDKQIFSFTTEISEFAIFIILVMLVLYLLFKIIYLLLLASSANKIVAILLLAISVVCINLVQEKFLIFIALYILIFFSFQFTCGSSFLTIRKKLFTILTLDIIAYFTILAIFDDNFRNYTLLLLEEIQLPVELF